MRLLVLSLKTPFVLLATPNGRLGRLLITLQLIGADVIKSPVLTRSSWFERKREIYRDHLNLSSRGDFDSWVVYLRTR